MFNMKTVSKTILAAAALLSTARIGSAAGGPRDHGYPDGWRGPAFVRHERFGRRAFVDRMRIAETLRWHRYRLMSDPYFFPGRNMVRAHDRFGRTVFIQVDPYSGAFIREVFL